MKFKQLCLLCLQPKNNVKILILFMKKWYSIFRNIDVIVLYPYIQKFIIYLGENVKRVLIYDLKLFYFFMKIILKIYILHG
jgi:hypothetical protein